MSEQEQRIQGSIGRNFRLAGIKKKKNNPKQMKDAKNKLLGEQESLEMWAEAFRELGTEDADEKFDRSFKECIEEELENLEKKGESESMSTIDRLNWKKSWQLLKSCGEGKLQE